MNVTIALAIDNRFRLATKDLILYDDFTDETRPVGYLPKILSADFLRSEISLSADGNSSIPNATFNVADGNKELYSYFSSKKVESIQCLYKIVIDGVVAKQIYCTLGDYSFANGTITFDIRAPESIIDNDYMQMFTPVSFQWLEIPEVILTAATGTWLKLPDPSWKIVAADYRRAYYYQRNPLADQDVSDVTFFVGMNEVGRNPANAYEAGTFGGRRKQKDATPSDDNYAEYIYPRHFDRIPIKNFYRQFHVIEDVVVSDDGTGVGGTRKQIVKKRGYTQTGSFYDTLNSAEPIFENFRSGVYDFVNNRFLVNFTCSVFGIGLITFAIGDEIPDGTSISIAGFGDSAGDYLIRTAPGFTLDYKYAQIDSSFGSAGSNYLSSTTTSPEIIAYLISGYGAMWYDQEFDIHYWMSSGRTPSAGVEPLSSDFRLSFLSGIPTDMVPDPKNKILGLAQDTTFGSTYGFKLKHNKKVPIFPVNTGNNSSLQINMGSSATAQFEERRTMDRLIVAASGIIPDPNTDPDYSAGFLWLGQKGKLVTYTAFDSSTNRLTDFTRIVEGDELKLFCRYKVHAVHKDIISPIDTNGMSGPQDEFPSPSTILELQIHNRHLDTDHDYAVNIYPRQGAAELPDPYDMRLVRSFDEDAGVLRYSAKSYSPFVTEQQLTEFPLELYQIDFYLGVLKIQVRGLSVEERLKIATDENYRLSFTDRRKGQRLDQILNFQDLVNDVSTSVEFTLDPDGDTSSAISVEDQNSSIINAATERFAVIKGSSLVAELQGSEYVVYEWIFLHIPYEGGYSLAAGVDAATPDTTAADADGSFGPQKGIKAYTNRMAYRPRFNGVEDLKRTDATSDAGSLEANRYFNNSVYRIMHDCVPQNASDLGKFFPIVYGRVYRVPMLHVISNPALEEASESAGDDIYIYASHKTGVSVPDDIIIELDVREYKTDRESIQKRLDDQRSGVLDQLPVSPFPTFIDGHRTAQTVKLTGQPVRNILSRPIRLKNPYHKLIEKQALDGRKYYGIQLRGNEWDERAGQADKRFPIRNGFGKTPLYATFSGYYDSYADFTNSGGVIEHPMDIVRHFVKTYGRKPYADNIIDERSCQNVKAATPNYRASIYLTEQLTFEEFITKLCEQFGIYRGSCDGRIFFYTYNISDINWNKPIIDKLNVLEDPKEESGGYQDYITDIVFKYRYDYPSKAYKETIYLNAKNDSNLSLASTALQGRNTKEISADWIQDHSTAFSVARSIAKVNASKRRSFDITIKVVEGIYPEIGDVVPVTIERLTLNEQPCIVVSHQIRQDGFIDLKLITIEPQIERVAYTIIEDEEPIIEAPVISSEPVISGSVMIDQVLSTTNGVWLNSPDSYTYQWLRDGVSILGATSASYTVVAADINAEITCEVVATNAGGSSAPAESNILTSNWRPILLARPSALIFDGNDPYCYGGASVGSPVTTLRTVNGVVIGSQGITSSQGTRLSSGKLSLDGSDDHYICNAHANLIEQSNTIIFGFDNPEDTTTAVRTLLIASSNTSEASSQQISLNYSRPGAPNATRQRFAAGDTSFITASLTGYSIGAGPYNFVLRSTPNSTMTAVILDGSLTSISSNTRSANDAIDFDWMYIGVRAIGPTPTLSQYWQGDIRHFAIDDAQWDDTDTLVYRTCAIAAGVMV